MRGLVRDARLGERILLDSAGTGDWHVGHDRDPRAAAVAARRGSPLEGVARRFKPGDFARFDYVLAMDRSNRHDLVSMAPDAASRAKVHLLRSFDEGAPAEAEVPDPYYGGPDGFDDVFDICLAACRGFLRHLRRAHALK